MFKNTVCLVGIVMLSQLFTPPAESREKSDRFICEKSSSGQNEIKMILRDGKTLKDLAGLRSEHFSVSGFTPERRCEIIKDRLNAFVKVSQSQQGKNVKLGFKTGRMNGYDVICGVESISAKCSALILTLTPSYVTNRTPDEALNEFIDSFGTFTSGRKFLEGTPGRGKLFFPINIILAQ
jgi:hypothetical protein